jgi:hypothetical protein
MARTKTILSISFLIFISLSVLCGLVWANTLFSRDHIGEKDFFVPWLAARTFLQYGDSPYSLAATERAQMIYYGNLAGKGQDPLRLSIPFPVELFYFPFSLITDYSLSRGIWMTCLEIALISLAILSLRLTGWKPVRTLLPIILIFSVFWIYGFLPLIGNNSVIFVSLAIVGLLLALREDRDELAGALLVIPLLKLEFTGFLVILILWWAFVQNRSRLIIGFMMTLTILMTFSFFLLLNWFLPFIGGWISHITYNPGLTPGTTLASLWPVFGPRLGWVISGIMLMLLFLEWRGVRRQGFRHLLWTTSLTLAATPLMGIPVASHDYVLLFFPLIHFFSIMAERWSRPGLWGLTGIGLIILFFGLWLVDGDLIFSSVSTSNGISALSFSGLLVLGLYWIRWWAVRPPQPWSKNLP